jgi:NAD(P)-dependent dehydrogenase (short-subunit alcohol dehydrogenase family)
MNRLNNSVAVVTGAGSGIGRQLSLQLAKAGASVVLVDINGDNLNDTEALILGQSKQASVKKVVLDVSDKEAVYKLADDTQAQFGKVNLVINNAGVAMASGTLWETSIDDFQWLMGINFNGVLYGTKAFLPYLQQAEWGHIVNVSSLFGLIGVPEQAHYNASKFAVRGLTESLRQELELAESKVSCTSIHPGGIKTNIASNARVSKELDTQTELIHNNFEEYAMTTAESAAQQILNGVLNNKRRVVIGKDAKILDWVQRHFPNHYQRVYQWLINRVVKQA